MTETVFAETMAAPEDGFDAMAPENVSPLVAWLASADSAGITGRVFEVEAGKLSVADGGITGPRSIGASAGTRPRSGPPSATSWPRPPSPTRCTGHERATGPRECGPASPGNVK